MSEPWYGPASVGPLGNASPETGPAEWACPAENRVSFPFRRLRRRPNFLVLVVLSPGVHFAQRYYICCMRDKSERLSKSIRMSPDVYYRAKVAAVISEKSLGQWVEEAIVDKLHHEGAQVPLVGGVETRSPR